MQLNILVVALWIPALLAKESLIRLPKVNSNGDIIKNGRIIGGTVATAGQYPWQVAIYKTASDGQYFCGGTLVSEQWILTAAQCVYEATSFKIQLGSNQLTSSDGNRVTVTATTFFYEPRFDPSVSLWHDVGLIKLDSPVTLNSNIQTIVYANFGYLYPGEVLTATGWGQTSDSNTDLMNDLYTTQVKVIDQFECQSYYGDQLLGSMICTVGNTYNEGMCYGDIGGPLLAPAILGNYTVAVAIGSWMSQSGCESTDPKGHTRIDAYNNWITDTIADNS